MELSVLLPSSNMVPFSAIAFALDKFIQCHILLGTYIHNKKIPAMGTVFRFPSMETAWGVTS